MSSTARRVKKKVHRESVDDTLPKWVRECANSPGRFRLRVPGPRLPANFDFSVNFGVYPSVREADRVGSKVREKLVKGVLVWDILTDLIGSGDVAAGVTSRWIFEVAGGWAAKGRSLGREVDLPGPYGTPREAREAIGVLVPRPKRWGRAAKSVRVPTQVPS